MKPNFIANDWIEYAENDFRVSNILSQTHPIPLEIVAYHCQQSAEKFVKAIFAQYNEPIPHIHDLVKLLDLLQNKGIELSDIHEACERLTPYGTSTRYPGGIYSISIEQMPFILGWAGEIRSAIHKVFELKD